MWRRSISVGLTAGVISTMGAFALATPSDASRGGQKVEMLDDCQPKTFNMAIGPGTCIGDGETTFDAFITELTDTKTVREWAFDASKLTIRAGRPVILENEGGELHTFTLVKAFGGGVVPILNKLSGNPVLAPECATGPGPRNVFVAADKESAFRTAGLKPGKYMFQCCIHPWMRVILTVK